MGVVATAKSYLGKVKYIFGANDVDGGKADCSSFVQTVYKKNGINIGRTTGEQWQEGSFVAKENLKVGHAVYFHSTYDSNYVDNVSHVGIYIGNGKFIHCSSSAGTVVEGDLNSNYWKSHYLGARDFGAAAESNTEPENEGGLVDGMKDKFSGWFKEELSGAVKPVATVVISILLLIVGALFMVATVKESGVKINA